MESIGNAQSFSSNTPITPSRSFSVETLTGLTPSWKTELNRSISVMEDRIPRGLQHRHKTCCEKGSCRGRWTCMVRKWFHCGNIISGQVDLYITKRIQLASVPVIIDGEPKYEISWIVDSKIDC